MLTVVKSKVKPISCTLDAKLADEKREQCEKTAQLRPLSRDGNKTPNLLLDNSLWAVVRIL